MAQGRLKHFGWGREGEGLTEAEEAAALDRYRRLFRVDRFDEVAPPPLADIALRPPRIAPPAALAACCSTETYDRAAHTYGKSFRDYARGLVGDYGRRPRCRRLPAERSRGRGGHRLGRRRAGGADPVRRRQQRRRRGRAAIDGTGKQGGGHPRPAPSRPGAGDRSRVARGAHPRRGVRAGARSPAAAARADPAAFSAEL